MFLLDTTVLVDHLRGRSSALIDRLSKETDSRCWISAMTAFEIYFGAIKSGRPKELERVSELLDFVAWLPFDETCVGMAAAVRHELESAGQKIGPYHLLTASIALANDLTLVTSNASEYRQIQGLKVEDWSAN